jgi:asparagine synthase (glutamine-hydrolysing)
MASFPSELKIRGRELKYVLRELGKNYLPRAILERGKQGFMFPVANWFRNELYTFIRDYILDGYFVRSGIFRRDNVLRLLREHRQNRSDHHVRLWMLLNLTIWHELFIEQKDIDAVKVEMMRHFNDQGISK